jgi:arylsulfatase A-like enzyme
MNVIFFITDQQRADHLGCAGNRVLQTPNIDKLAGRLKCLITDRYSLTIYDGFPGYGDLFDLQEDPHELNNLWDTDPELRHEMVEKLLFEMLKQQSIYPKKQAVG